MLCVILETANNEASEAFLNNGALKPEMIFLARPLCNYWQLHYNGSALQTKYMYCLCFL